jgi:hypothetical protein
MATRSADQITKVVLGISGLNFSEVIAVRKFLFPKKALLQLTVLVNTLKSMPLAEFRFMAYQLVLAHLLTVISMLKIVRNCKNPLFVPMLLALAQQLNAKLCAH